MENTADRDPSGANPRFPSNIAHRFLGPGSKLAGSDVLDPTLVGSAGMVMTGLRSIIELFCSSGAADEARRPAARRAGWRSSLSTIETRTKSGHPLHGSRWRPGVRVRAANRHSRTRVWHLTICRQWFTAPGGLRPVRLGITRVNSFRQSPLVRYPQSERRKITPLLFR
jgi:hypothetical protein